jgi:hypothetical protein
MTTARIITSSLVITALATGFSAAVLADGPQAVAGAAQHAGLAAGSTDIAGVHRHLHHVLNCLVGPDGDGFDGAAGNPCAAAGGAIPQTMDNAMKMKLEKAAADARMGIADDDLDAAKKTAMEIQAELK